MKITLGPGSEVWKCLDCGFDFIWYSGTSGLTKPSGCGNCDSQNIEQIDLKEE